jgi:hypothetical protein
MGTCPLRVLSENAQRMAGYVKHLLPRLGGSCATTGHIQDSSPPSIMKTPEGYYPDSANSSKIRQPE